MTIKSIALLIPAAARKQILSKQLIHVAMVHQNDPNTRYLMEIWHNFIEPGKEMSNCNLCIDRILTNFRQMEETLIKIEEESNLLDSI